MEACCLLPKPFADRLYVLEDQLRVVAFVHHRHVEQLPPSPQHAISQLRRQQKIIVTPDVQDPGYVRQKRAGKLWVRERIHALVDPGSFVEVGSIAGKPVVDEKTGELLAFVRGNIVTGWGRVDGKRVFVTADDFSVRGGHADGGVAGKAAFGETLARKARVPLVRDYGLIHIAAHGVDYDY